MSDDVRLAVILGAVMLGACAALFAASKIGGAA